MKFFLLLIFFFFIGAGFQELFKRFVKPIKVGKPKPKKEYTNNLIVKNLTVLYDESKGHVIQGEIDGRTMYYDSLMIGRSEAEEYIRSLKRSYYISEDFIKFSHRKPKWMIEDSFQMNEEQKEKYSKLSQRPVVVNRNVNLAGLNKESYYTFSLKVASRYSDEELKDIENTILEYNINQKYNIPTEELLKLNIIDDTDAEREFYWEILSTREL